MQVPFTLLWTVCLCISNAVGVFHQHHPKPIIIDTDIFSDVDDVGALAVANVLHHCGYASLEAVMINTGSKYGALAANAISTYYGNGDVPIGAIRPLTNETFLDTYYYKLGEYASKVAHNFPRTLKRAEETELPVPLYRSILASAANASVTIISIGFLTNLAELLESEADDLSTMSGFDLIGAKVKELVVMGGAYPSGWEYNFGGHDPQSAATVLSKWPSDVPITFSGAELGESIFSGQGLASRAPPDSPVLAAYRWYGDRCNTTSRSYDPLTVLYGIMDLGVEDTLYPHYFVYGNKDGYNTINGDDGTNAWVDDCSVTNQHWLKLRYPLSRESLGEDLTRLYAWSPEQGECCFGGVCGDDGGWRVQG